MKGELQGKVLLTTQAKAHGVKLDEIEALLQTPTARDAARIGLFFGPSVAGYLAFVDAIGLDLNRALLIGHEIDWTRPFKDDEPLSIELKLAEYSEKDGREIGTVETRFSTPQGELVQTQRTTFMERAV
jgi:hypothetical protein